ncbi:MFS transporter [Robertmurraya massiliosenegalensis]|uniref:MFS transporter n=1 Tax=Robertmurraya TaxID=2837507 RepID=UPI0039A48508
MEEESKLINRRFYMVCLAIVMIIFTVTSGVPVIPKLIQTFELTAGYALWPQGIFAMAMVIFQPLFGWMSDNYGPKKVGVLGAFIMLFGAIIIAISPALSFGVAVFGFFLTGVSGAATIPLGFNFIGKIFAEEERGKKLAIMSIIILIGNALAPIKGGFFTDAVHWTANYWASAIFSAIAIYLFAKSLPNDTGVKSKFDVGGAILLLLSLSGLASIPLILNSFGTTTSLWIPSFVIFIISLIVLFIVQKKKTEPLLDIDYVTNRHFWVPAAIVLFTNAINVGTLYLLTFYIQDIQGKPSTIVGILQMLFFVATAVGSYLSGKAIARFSARRTMSSGTLLVIAGMGMFIMVNLDTSVLYFALSVIVIGLGFGILGPARKTIVLSEANLARIGVTTFTFSTAENTISNIGGSFVILTYTMLVVSKGASAVSTTALILTLVALVALLFMPLIPNNVVGFQGKKNSAKM